MNNALRKRSSNTKPQRKLYIIVGEGEVTENAYFSAFKSQTYRVVYKTPSKHHGGSMDELVQCIEDQETSHRKNAETEYWIVADTEKSTRQRDLRPLIQWVQEDYSTHHLAITNQQFEDWLLLHFQNRMSKNDPVQELDSDSKMPGYSGKKHPNTKGKRKHISNINEKRILTAVDNAYHCNMVVSDQPGSGNTSEYERPHTTSVPHLVEKLITDGTFDL